MNSVAGGMRTAKLRTNLGVGGVDMPSIRSAVNDNVGFEIEENEKSPKAKKDKGKSSKAVSFMGTDESSNEEDKKNRRNFVPGGPRFSSRFPPSRSRVLDS